MPEHARFPRFWPPATPRALPLLPPAPTAPLDDDDEDEEDEEEDDGAFVGAILKMVDHAEALETAVITLQASSSSSSML